MRIAFAIAMAITFSLSEITIHAATYFVATNGVDSNLGTIGAPFKTLTRGTLGLVAGDTLYIRGGVYREVLQPTTSGTAATPILITAYSNEVVTITGADVVTNWSVYSNNIYQASVNWDLGDTRNQIFVDGEMMHQARYPNFGEGDLLHPVVSTGNIGSPTNIVTSPDWDGKPVNYWTGARMIGGFGSAWAHQTAIVGSSSGNSLTLAAGTLSGQWFTGSGPAYLFGLMSMLDSDKEWYLNTNAGVLYLQIPNGGDPNSHFVEMKRRVWTVNLTNISYVTVQGLKLRAGAVQMSRGYGLALIGCEGRFLSHYMKFARGDSGDTQNVWDRGVQFTSTNSLLEHCTIFDTVSSGVYLEGMSNTLTRNFIFNINYLGVNGAGINIRGRRHLITFNTISNVGWAGFAPANDSQTGHKILYNDVTKIAEVTKDTGVFYAASGSNLERTRLAYNWFHDVFPWRQSGVLIYLDGTCVNNDIDHNVCWNEIGRDSIQVAGNSKNDNFYNNTIFNARPIASASSLISFSNNLYLSWVPETQLVDWQNHDFRLKPGSTSVDVGRVIPGYTAGYTGTAPDLGAYETGGPYWVPGIDGWSIDQPGIRTDRPLVWSSTSATVQGMLISAGTAPTSVRLYWGINNGGTNMASWSNVVNLGVYSTNPVSFAPEINGLTSGSNHSYRFYATNAFGQYWGQVRTFTAGGSAWISDASASWSDSSRWQSGVVADGVGHFADFSTINITENRTVILDSSRTVGALRFDDLSPSHAWSIAGNNSLTLSTLNSLRRPSVEIQDAAVIFGVPLIGNEGLEKTGPGSLFLNGQNSYTGITLANCGSLFVNGSLSNSLVEVAANAVLGGAGLIAQTVTVKNRGILSPGANGIGSAGTLAVSNLNLNGATLLFDFASNTNAGGGVNDLICLQPGAILKLTPGDGGIIRPVVVLPNLLDGYLTNRTYMIISNAASVVGDVTTLFSAPGLEARFFTNSGVGPYNVFMTVSNAVGRTLVWRGTDGAVWDIGSSSNWLEKVLGSAMAFNQRDQVLFDDFSSNNVVNLVGNLSPASATVDSSVVSSYTLKGNGKITGTASFTKSGTGVLILKTPNDYTGPTRIEDGTFIFGSSNVLPANTALSMGQSDSNRQSVAKLDLSLASQTVATLKIASLRLTAMINTSPDFIDSSKITNQIVIGSGQNLTVNGNVLIGDTVLPHLLASITSLRGGGLFNVQTNGGIFQFNGNDFPGSAGATKTYMDMSGLATATINLGSSGSFYVGDRSTGGDGDSASILTLASNTTVTAGNLSIGNGQRIKLQTLKLGGGSNIFNINNVQLGVARDNGQICFNTAAGSLKLRAANGTGRAVLVIGGNSGTTYGASNQFVELEGHYADLLLSALKVGEENRGSSGMPYSSNFFGFSSGVLDTTTLRIGNRPGNPSSTPALWFNVCNLSGGLVTIGSDGIIMGNSSGYTGANSTNAATLNISAGAVAVGNSIVMATQNATTGNNAVISTLNITGGAVIVNGNILCGIGVANPAPRLTHLNLSGSNAVLDLTGHAIGGVNNVTSNVVNFIDVLNFQAGTLQNVAQINGGADLIKSGPNLLTLSGNNTYTGGTVASNGTLNVAGTIGGAGAVRVLAGAVLTGNGSISGPVTISGTLSPGNSVGAMRIANTLTLNAGSQTLLELNSAAGANDSVRNLTHVNYGGTLTVTNIGGSLVAGNSFMLFSAMSRGGNFSSLSLPPLAAGLIWTNKLAVDGSIAVVSLLSQPQISHVSISGLNLVISGVGGNPNGSYLIVTSTNLTLPINLWLPLVTNAFNSSGAFTDEILMNSNVPATFFLLKQ